MGEIQPGETTMRETSARETRMRETRMREGATREGAAQPDYAVPALDKAIDILELLAEQSGGLNQGAIAAAVGRSASQIFRVLQRLERRGWIMRESGLYQLSTRMFDLAHRQPALRGLISAALPAMRELSESVRHSCNLSVLDADRVRVIAQVESPSDFGFLVRVGAQFPVDTTPAGQVLSGASVGGYLRQADSLQPGIIDLVVPVLTRDRVAAVITVPYIATSYSTLTVDEVLERVVAAGEQVSSRLQGMQGWR